MPDRSRNRVRRSGRAGPAPEIAQLLLVLEQAYSRRSWHGTNLRGSIRRLSARAAARRPAAGRHNIRELVVHCAYWKYAVRRHLTGGRRGSFPVGGSNWFARPDGATDAAWRADIELLDEQHRLLIDAVAQVRARQLHQTSGRGIETPFSLISGAAAHDLYHAGQIQLIKRMIAID